MPQSHTMTYENRISVLVQAPMGCWFRQWVLVPSMGCWFRVWCDVFTKPLSSLGPETIVVAVGQGVGFVSVGALCSEINGEM